MTPALRFCAWLLTACSLAAIPVSAPLLDKQGNPPGFRSLSIGDSAPDFALPGIDGKVHRLADFAGTDVLMVLFTSNHCPTSHAIERRLQTLRNDLRSRSFALVAINPNHPDGLRIDELGYGEYGDSFEEMKPYAQKNGWDFPYLYDGDKQLVARAYGCLATPHVFIFDRERKLRYQGRFDNSRYVDDATVTSPDARNAIDALLAGKPVPVAQTKPHGCSTKWREKRAGHVVAEAAWKEIPVVLEKIDVAGVAALRSNPSGKHRLINLWATWCAPCVEEFPDLVAISRQYDRREFELITLSVDDEKQFERARAFLQSQGAGLTKGKQDSVNKEGRRTNHYLVSAHDQDALAKALDPEWPGPIPYTILVAPGGRILWRQVGTLDPARAREAIVEALTPYYSPPPRPSE
jgi:peroxiredoxin/thiol-disulfide isomerase/thioredoxin